jgi:hypothetical protein
MLAKPQQEKIMYLRFLVLVLSVFSLSFAAGAADGTALGLETSASPAPSGVAGPVRILVGAEILLETAN